VGDVDLFEVNEAFSVVAMAAMQDVGIPRDRINAFGGAIALGHPIGCTGARITVTLLHSLIQEDKELGLATLCVSGGQGMALVLKRL
jgi:acetyl-CoA C-acetyltransferase